MGRTNDERTTHVLALLADEVPGTTEGLKGALRKAEAAYMDTIRARISTQSELFTARLQYRHPKDKELTDWDRKIMLDAHTSSEQAAYELAAGYEKALEQRIAVIHTLLVQ